MPRVEQRRSWRPPTGCALRGRGACTDAERRAALWLHDEVRAPATRRGWRPCGCARNARWRWRWPCSPPSGAWSPRCTDTGGDPVGSCCVAVGRVDARAASPAAAPRDPARADRGAGRRRRLARDHRRLRRAARRARASTAARWRRGCSAAWRPAPGRGVVASRWPRRAWPGCGRSTPGLARARAARPDDRAARHARRGGRRRAVGWSHPGRTTTRRRRRRARTVRRAEPRPAAALPSSRCSPRRRGPPAAARAPCLELPSERVVLLELGPCGAGTPAYARPAPAGARRRRAQAPRGRSACAVDRGGRGPWPRLPASASPPSTPTASAALAPADRHAEHLDPRRARPSSARVRLRRRARRRPRALMQLGWQ